MLLIVTKIWKYSFIFVTMSNCQSLLGFLVLVQFTLFRASFHFEFINYFELQGFDLLVDWRLLPSFQKPHLDFLQIIMHF